MFNNNLLGKVLKLIICLALIGLSACKNNESNSSLIELDLMKNGLPIKVLAPENPEVISNDMGLIQDVTVKGEGNYSIQIVGADAHITDLKVLVGDKLNEIKASPFFTEVVQEDDNGFIFKKTISEERINYDFRYIKIQGDKEYVFQTGLIGQFSLEDVKEMYEAVR